MRSLAVDNCFQDMKYDTISINNTNSAAMAIKYLIDSGHTEIGYLRGKAKINNFQYRYLGFCSALRSSNLTIHQEYVLEVGPSLEKVHSDVSGWLASHQKLPTAFFADNDFIALSAMRAFQEYGYKIPNDISIVGFDDTPFCEISVPPLTMVRVFKEEFGAAAVNRLVEHMKSGTVISSITVMRTEFVERKSVRKI
ncbi:MAG: substrate-binding domain-containing protein [Bacillota bacterium]|nr:substrate-binding domain-containing protein [Bacillota bacterium]